MLYSLSMSYLDDKYEQFEDEDRHSSSVEKAELKILRDIRDLNKEILKELKKIDKKLFEPVSLRIDFDNPTSK